jgi:hypothetical protein
MADERTYTVYTTGGDTFSIKAHRYSINEDENRVYFMDAKDQTIEEWVVFLSGVVAIHITNGKFSMGPLNL